MQEWADMGWGRRFSEIALMGVGTLVFAPFIGVILGGLVAWLVSAIFGWSFFTETGSMDERGYVFVTMGAIGMFANAIHESYKMISESKSRTQERSPR